VSGLLDFPEWISNFVLNLGSERDFFENRDEKEGAVLYTSIIFIVFKYLTFGILTHVFGAQFSQFLTKQSKYADLLF